MLALQLERKRSSIHVLLQIHHPHPKHLLGLMLMLLQELKRLCMLDQEMICGLVRLGVCVLFLFSFWYQTQSESTTPPPIMPAKTKLDSGIGVCCLSVSFSSYFSIHILLNAFSSILNRLNPFQNLNPPLSQKHAPPPSVEMLMSFLICLSHFVNQIHPHDQKSSIDSNNLQNGNPHLRQLKRNLLKKKLQLEKLQRRQRMLKNQKFLWCKEWLVTQWLKVYLMIYSVLYQPVIHEFIP